MGIFDSWKKANGFDMLGKFLHPEDAYKDAGRAANQGYNQAQGYLNPYNQNGVGQTGRLNSAEDALLDPAALQAKWGASYETSPYAKQLMEQSKNSGLDAASSMGLMGSSGALNNIQTGAGNIVSQDREKYMKDLMEKYMTGIGIGKDMYSTGANAAGAMSGNAMSHGDTMAGIKYGQSAAPGQLFGNLLGMGANAGMNYATGGMSGATNAFNPGH